MLEAFAFASADVAATVAMMMILSPTTGTGGENAQCLFHLLCGSSFFVFFNSRRRNLLPRSWVCGTVKERRENDKRSPFICTIGFGCGSHRTGPPPAKTNKRSLFSFVRLFVDVYALRTLRYCNDEQSYDCGFFALERPWNAKPMVRI